MTKNLSGHYTQFWQDIVCWPTIIFKSCKLLFVVLSLTWDGMKYYLGIHLSDTYHLAMQWLSSRHILKLFVSTELVATNSGFNISMSKQVVSVIRKILWPCGGIRFQSDGNFLEIDNICLDDILNYWLMATKTNKNFTATDLVTAFEWSQIPPTPPPAPLHPQDLHW